MPLFSQPNEDSNHLRALVREQGQPLPHPSQQLLFPERPDIDTRNCAFVSGTFRYLDHILITANEGSYHILLEGKKDNNDDANELVTITKTKGEYLRTILKWVLKQEFWERNSAPAGGASNVLNVFVEEQKCLFCDRQYDNDARATACSYGHIDFHPR
ncbi:hypothetical protein FRB91_010429 [Serendipita sp. 411]|nr:hypothetical protein FRB91_010429 [Serendipita sp. 411]